MKNDFINYLTNLDQIMNSESNVRTKKLVYIRGLHLIIFDNNHCRGIFLFLGDKINIWKAKDLKMIINCPLMSFNSNKQ